MTILKMWLLLRDEEPLEGSEQTRRCFDLYFRRRVLWKPFWEQTHRMQQWDPRESRQEPLQEGGRQVRGAGLGQVAAERRWEEVGFWIQSEGTASSGQAQ